MVGIKLNPDGYQLRCSNYILKSTLDPSKLQQLIVKAPTGSGKTVILIDFIEKLNSIKDNLVFVWLSPGGGELEEQSKESMEEKSPESSVKNIHEVLVSGFEAKDIVFINWEMVSKSGNKATSKIERKNLFDRIASAHKEQLDFVIIVDEEHSNDTRKAQDIIDAFSAIKEIRVSATANKRPSSDYFEVSESEVISEGFITKAIYINYDVKSEVFSQDNETNFLIEKGLNQRLEILKQYKLLGKNINPLLIIQFPNSSDALISRVEDFLENMGINYDNKTLSKWLSEEKLNLENLEDNSGIQQVLIMKQAISTGWDCPRAKILVKLRENMNEDFEIQTIGRIRRMPERIHYGVEELDCCYLYTFDKKYVESVRSSSNSVFNVKQVKAKEKTQSFRLVKQVRDKSFVGIDERKSLEIIFEYFRDFYKLDFKSNKDILEAHGYNFSITIDSKILTGKFQKISDITDLSDNPSYYDLKYEVSVKNHGLDLLHSTYSISKSVGMNYEKTNAILNMLFKSGISSSKNKILKLSKKEYFAFIINNEQKLREDFKDATRQLVKSLKFVLNPNQVDFAIPLSETLKYIDSEKDKNIIETSAYYDYSEQTLVSGLRSSSEILFERYCEDNDNVDWVYKNGDVGSDYFSIVYLDAIFKQWLFFPDYIVRLKDGSTFIIETKGGEYKGISKNIDKQTVNKFYAFKQYAKEYKLNWAFVRDRNSKLYFNNSEYEDDLNDDSWRNIKELF
jgi:type III restriction enzyme